MYGGLSWNLLRAQEGKVLGLLKSLPNIQDWATCCFTLSSSQADSGSYRSHLLFSFSRRICLQLVHSSCLWGLDQNLQQPIRHRDVHMKCSEQKMLHISAKPTQGPRAPVFHKSALKEQKVQYIQNYYCGLPSSLKVWDHDFTAFTSNHKYSCGTSIRQNQGEDTRGNAEFIYSGTVKLRNELRNPHVVLKMTKTLLSKFIKCS